MPDTTAPSTPGTPQVITANLGWDQSTDDSGQVAAYDIYTAPKAVVPATYPATARVLSSAASWRTVVQGFGMFVATADNSALTILSADGITWSAGGALPSSGDWRALGYSSLYGYWVALKSGTAGAASAGTSLATWTTRTGLTGNWVAATVTAPVVVAIQPGSTVAASNADAVTWIPRALPSAAPWSAITYANGTYVAIAGNTTASNAVAVSTNDGASWAAGGNLPVSTTWSGIAFGNGRFVAVAGGSGASAVTAASTDGGTTWVQGALPVADGWSAVTFNAGVFYAIAGSAGVSSVAATSTDGLTWVQRALPSAATWSSVAGGLSGFVAVAAGATSTTAATIPDPGPMFTPRTLPVSGTWSAVATSGPVFLALTGAATNGFVARSTDGIIWANIALPTNATWLSVGFGNGVWVVLASGGVAASSIDGGLTWTARTVPSGTWAPQIAYGNGVFAAVTASGTGSIVTSPDGITWTARTTPAGTYPGGVAYGAGVFLAPASNFAYAAVSTDTGATWTTRTLPASTGWRAIAYGNGMWMIGSGTAPTILTSTDGVTWVTRSQPFGFNNYSLAWGNGYFLVTSNGMPAIMQSPDGITWSTRLGTAGYGYYFALVYSAFLCTWVVLQSNTSTTALSAPDGAGPVPYATINALTAWTAKASVPGTAPILNGSVCGNRMMLAAGTSGVNYLTSSDYGTTVTVRTFPVSDSWKAMAFGNGIFVVAGPSGVMTSSDGVTWTQRTVPVTQVWQSAAYGNGRFVIVGYTTGTVATNVVLTSFDGITWTARTMLATQVWYSVYFGGGQFVALGVGTVASTSADGITWASRTLPGASATWGCGTYGNGMHVALTGKGTASAVAASSPDGVTWIQRALPASSTWLCVGFTGGMFRAATAAVNLTAVSTDGMTWATGPGMGSGNGLNTLVAADGVFVGFGAAVSVWAIGLAPAYTVAGYDTYTVRARDAAQNTSAVSGPIVFSATGITTTTPPAITGQLWPRR